MDLNHNNNNIYWTPTSTPSSSSIDPKRSKIVSREQDKLEVVHGEENVMDAILQFLFRTDKIDCCYDYSAPSMVIEVEAYKKLLVHIKERGIKLRFLTDINKDNIIYCKELMTFAEEIRHLEGVKASFSISEKEYISTVTLNESQPISQLIYSNLKDIVKQHQYLFETLWNKAMPVEQRIKQIEENRGIEKTEVLYGSEDTINAIMQFQRRTIKKWDVCVGSTMPSISMEAKLKQGYLDAWSRGVKIRYVTEITRDNLDYCKEIMKVGALRHLDEVKGSFAVSESEYVAGIKDKRNSASFEHLVYSNAHELVAQQQYVFESFWHNAIPAEQKIRELEEGVDIEKTEIIHNPSITKKSYINLVESAEDEVLLIFPSVNAFHRVHSIGIIEKLLEKASSSRNHVRIRVITPSDSFVNSISQKAADNYEISKKKEDEQEDFFNIRSIVDPTSDIKITSLVVDRKASLVIELKDDSKKNFVDAIGSSTYSTSKPTVLSYISIFENLWRQIELYDLLKAHDKMQKEFVNVAAHELRTPAQSIIGYAELLLTDPQYIQIDKKEGFLDAIYRNSIRLTRLTKDILDISRIENQTLQLHEQRISLNDLISLVIQDIQRLRQGVITGANDDGKASKAKAISLSYKSSSLSGKEQQFNNRNNSSAASIVVEIDRVRIMQVLSNLLENAIKFTKEDGTISVIVEVQKNQNNKKEVIISIKDNGTGIDPETIPRLFTKFCTKSSSVLETTGTGLGLYISKSIIEAHGGRIWAQNNAQGTGATFSFSLPV